GLAAVCGWCLAELIRNYGVRAAPLLLGLIVLTKGTYNYMAKELYYQQWSARAAKNYVAKIIDLPWHSGFIVGAVTPLIHFLAAVGTRPYWKTISSGAGWPAGKLDEAIQEFFYAGRIVYVDFDPELWQPGVRGESRETNDLERIKQNYK